MTPVRLILADDDRYVRSGLTTLLRYEHDLTVVGEAADGADAIRRACQLRPDVVLMDVLMPGTDGVEATRQLTTDSMLSEAGEPIRVLILTTLHDDEVVHATLRAGASGFVHKDVEAEELAAAVHAVARGDGWLSPGAAAYLIAEYRNRRSTDRERRQQIDELTARERQMLELVAHGLTNAEIMERCLVSEATVKTHISRVMMKLGLGTRAQAVAFAYKSGFVDPGAPTPAPAPAPRPRRAPRDA